MAPLNPPQEIWNPFQVGQVERRWSAETKVRKPKCGNGSEKKSHLSVSSALLAHEWCLVAKGDQPMFSILHSSCALPTTFHLIRHQNISTRIVHTYMHLVCNYMANWQLLTTLACHSHSYLLQTVLHFAGCLSAVTRVKSTYGLPDQSMASDSHFMVSYDNLQSAVHSCTW